MGGFHLVGESKGEIEKIASSFRKLGVRYVGPCHCSGDAARQLFKKEYCENFINVGAHRRQTNPSGQRNRYRYCAHAVSDAN